MGTDLIPDAQESDVIVIGAGPAGTMAAKECAKQNLRTILIEKEKIPRFKSCAGCISLKAIKLIGSEIPPYLIDGYVRGFRFFSPSLKSVDIVSNNPIGISTTRDRYDSFLVELAKSEGCIFIDSDRVIDVAVIDNEVVCRLQSGRSIRGLVALGADGMNGITAPKTATRDKWSNDQVGLCLETTIILNEEQMKHIDPEIFELYFIDIPLGYAWLLPKKSSISLGIGGIMEHLHNPRETLMQFINIASKNKGIDLKITRSHAHLVPVGGLKRKIVSDHVMLVGDAAGFVDPLTGEGIYYAMKSGLLAAVACKEAIESNDLSASFLETHYSKVCDEAFGKDLKIALDLTYKFHDNLDVFLNLIARSGPTLTDLARGDLSYRVLRRRILRTFMISLLNKRLRNILH